MGLPLKRDNEEGLAPVERKKSPPAGLMLVTDRNRSRLPLDEAVREALAGGVRAVQLREKDLSSRELYRWGERLLPLCRERGALFLVNGRVEVALAVGADGVHLPADGFHPGRSAGDGRS